jgi:hypothetical protein
MTKQTQKNGKSTVVVVVKGSKKQNLIMPCRPVFGV